VVEAQLDPFQARRKRNRCLEKLAAQLEYRQDRRKEAARVHRRTRLKRLRAKGIFISQLPKCFGKNLTL